MKILKEYKFILLFAVLGVAGFFFFTYSYYHKDEQKLLDFMASYQAYDQAAARYTAAVVSSNPPNAAAGDSSQAAGQALADLRLKASARISSMIKHDGELMSAERQIAALSGQEMEALKACQQAAAGQGGNLSQLVKTAQDLADQRRAAYAHFRDLLGLKN